MVMIFIINKKIIIVTPLYQTDLHIFQKLHIINPGNGNLMQEMTRRILDVRYNGY